MIFVVWNNRGYREIETSMLDVGVEPLVRPAGAAGLLQAGRSLRHISRAACRHRWLCRCAQAEPAQRDCRTSSKSPSTDALPAPLVHASGWASGFERCKDSNNCHAEMAVE